MCPSPNTIIRSGNRLLAWHGRSEACSFVVVEQRQQVSHVRTCCQKSVDRKRSHCVELARSACTINIGIWKRAASENSGPKDFMNRASPYLVRCPRQDNLIGHHWRSCHHAKLYSVWLIFRSRPQAGWPSSDPPPVSISCRTQVLRPTYASSATKTDRHLCIGNG
jgi:hypothetical protein